MAEYRDPTPISPREPEYDKSKVSKEVANYTQQVRGKKKGHDVREALARNSEIADIKAEDAVATSYDTKARQDDVENRFDDQMAGNTDIDEVIDARRPEGEEAYPTLQRRLDAEHQKVTTQLAQTGFRLSWLNLLENVDATDDIQTILNTYEHVIVDDVFKIDVVKSIHLNSNNKLTFTPEGRFEAIPTEQGSYAIIKGTNVSNIQLIHPRLIGERDDHSDENSSGEWGMGLELRGCSNVEIINPEISNCWGDGIYIGRTSTINSCSNVVIKGGRLDNNRRQGMSVISVKGLFIENTEIKNTNGTPPQAGIDFEPNNGDEFLQDIVLNNVKTENNSGSGFEINLLNYNPPANTEVSMTFNDCHSVNDKDHGLYIWRFNGKTNGRITVNNLLVDKSGNSGIRLRSVSKDIGRIIINNPTFINVNPNGNDGRAMGSDLAVIRGTNDYIEDESFKIGNIDINSPKSIRSDGISRDSSQVAFIDNYNNSSDIFEDIKLIIDSGLISRSHLIRNSNIITGRKLVSSFRSNGLTELSFPSDFSLQNRTIMDLRGENTLKLNDVYYENELEVVNGSEYEFNSFVKKIIPPANKKLYPLEYENGIQTVDYLASLTLTKIDGEWVVKNIVGDWTPVEPVE